MTELHQKHLVAQWKELNWAHTEYVSTIIASLDVRLYRMLKRVHDIHFAKKKEKSIANWQATKAMQILYIDNITEHYRIFWKKNFCPF